MSESILVKLPNWMGDILFSYDLLHTLARHFNRVGMLTSAQHEELFSIFPIPGTQAITYPTEEWPHLSRLTVRKIRDFKPEAGLLLPNSFGSALVLRYAGVSRLFGYGSEHRGLLLKKSIRVPPQRIHQTQYYLKLLELFDLQAIPYPSNHSSPKEKLVILHPGASKRPRAWHLERFAKVAQEIRERGFDVLFVSGETIRVGPFPVMVRPSLSDFSRVLKGCSLFIGNDSGPLHLAQQCGAPVLGIYGPGNPLTTGPRPISPHRVVYHTFPCSPCRQNFFKDCAPAPSGKPFCIETINPNEVLKAALELLPNP